MPDRRRWLQFGITRAFLLLTVFGIWLGWGLNWMHSRREILEYFKTLPPKGMAISIVAPEQMLLSGKPWNRLPITLRLLGAKPIGQIQLPAGAFTRYDADRIQAAFPEASVILN